MFQLTDEESLVHAKDGKVMFNDRLGSTVAVKGDESYSMTSMTAFGESGDSGAFFTGKPFIGELGYAFLMRSYRPENGKWQTADPMGYPDGWNALAYCNNGVTSCVDLWAATQYEIQNETLTGSSALCSNSGDYTVIANFTVVIDESWIFGTPKVEVTIGSDSLIPTFKITSGGGSSTHAGSGQFMWDFNVRVVE